MTPPVSRSCRTDPSAIRWGDEGAGRWNLQLGDIAPRLSLLGAHDELVVPLDLPRFDIGETEGGGIMRRGVPAKRIGDRLVTTVFDLLCAQLGVGRDGLPGDWPTGYDDPRAGHPGVAAGAHERRQRPSSGSRVSSRATPRSPKAAR